MRDISDTSRKSIFPRSGALMAQRTEICVDRSRLYATDIFQTAFAADPMDANIGKRYRQAILEPGSSRPESEILKTFLGRMPNSEAFHRELEAGSGQQ